MSESVASSEDFLQLSGIQHIAFCKRQWALINLEQVWADNVRTVEGSKLHENVDDPSFHETRKDIRTVRAMPIISYQLKLSGTADLVEFQKKPTQIGNETCQLRGFDGWWKPIPVEYKRGKPKPDNRDAVQLCAQAIALEEMLHVSIQKGFLFYGISRRRHQVSFDHSLRNNVLELAQLMHYLAKNGATPKAEKKKHCTLCSLIEYCHPNLTLRHRSVREYLERIEDVEGDSG